MSTLDDARSKTEGDRLADYGDADVSLGRIARFWSAYLGRHVYPSDVAAMMALLKISRIAGERNHHDSWVDLCGYGALGGDIIDRGGSE